MKITSIVFASLLLILFSCGKTSGLAPGSSGCTTCKIFVTATTHDGNYGGVAGADALCATDANLPAGGGTYKALLGASTRFPPSTNWPLKASTTYVRSNGVTVIGTTTAARILSFNLTNSFATGGSAWTGLTGAMAKAVENCTDWTTNAGNPANYGDATQLDGRSIAQGAFACSSTPSLYCVEQ
jgi:hypothetical protein